MKLKFIISSDYKTKRKYIINAETTSALERSDEDKRSAKMKRKWQKEKVTPCVEGDGRVVAS